MANLNLRDKNREWKPDEKSMRLLREHAGRAEEQLAVHERENARKMQEHRERTAAGLAAQAATPEYQRRMDAKHKVAADLAAKTDMSRAEAESFVARSMAQGDRQREGR